MATKLPLEHKYSAENKYEIGLDEAGRGPMFGRLYVAAVILPEGGLSHPDIKDSKKIKSKKKMREVAAFIKEHSYAWSVHYIENGVIDDINILQAVYKGMHECIKSCIQKINVFKDKTCLLIDGNSFKPFMCFDPSTDHMFMLPYETVEGGDNKYQSIAAASILAKCARDDYIEEWCDRYPELKSRYALDKNMGYGTAAHFAGIREHGITQWHRKTFGLCKTAAFNPVLLVCSKEEDDEQ
jgi:ribonuclease HII